MEKCLKCGKDMEEHSEENWCPNPKRRITITYDIITEESSKEGDYAESGWEDEEGEEVECLGDAIRIIEQHGGVESGGDWFSTVDPYIEDYGSDEQKFFSFHLNGFSDEEEKQLRRALKKRGNYV